MNTTIWLLISLLAIISSTKSYGGATGTAAGGAGVTSDVCTDAGCSDQCAVDATNADEYVCSCDRACWQLSSDDCTCIPAIETTCMGDKITISLKKCGVDGYVVLSDETTKAQDVLEMDCMPITGDTFHNFSITPGMCGTKVVDDGEELAYRASLKMWVEDPHVDDSGHHSIISRGVWYVVEAECAREKHLNLSRSFKPENADSPTTAVACVDGFADIEIALDIYKDVTFAEKYDTTAYPVSYTLSDVIPFAITIDSADDDIEVFTKNCYALPEPNPKNMEPFPIIKDGCLNEATMKNYTSPNLLSNRFSIEAFRFKYSLPGINDDTDVILQCEIVVCVAGDESSTCSKKCGAASSGVEKRSIVKKNHIVRKRSSDEDFVIVGSTNEKKANDPNSPHGGLVETKGIKLPNSGPFQITGENPQSTAGGASILPPHAVIAMITAAMLAITSYL